MRPRILTAPAQSLFLLGPRGSGKITWLRAVAALAGLRRRIIVYPSGPVLQTVEDVEAVCDALATQQHLLDETGLAVWPDGTCSGSYRFQHALYQQILYEQLGTARRMQLHRRVGVRLEEVSYGARAGEIAAVLPAGPDRGSLPAGQGVRAR